MICGKCNNSVPEGFAFCPHCGQKLEAPALAEPVCPVEAPVIARSAMPKEEEYSGRYESGDMPEPVIRFSKNLAAQQAAPAAQTPAEPEIPAPVAEVPQVQEMPAPVAQVPATKTCTCGAILREGAKFCNACGKPVAVEEPKVEVPAEPVMEEPKVEAPAEPDMEEPAVLPVEEPERLVCKGCGATLREGAKFCTVCGQPAQATAEPETSALVEIPAEPEIPVPVEIPTAPEMPASAEPETPAQQPQNKCPACGADYREGAKFCNICGQRLQVAETPVQQAVPPVQQPAAPAQQPTTPPQQKPALKKCPLCGTVVAAEAPVCTGCGAAFRVQAPVQRPVSQPGTVPPAALPKKPGAKPAGKRSKAPVAIAVVLALLVVGVVIAGFLTNWFGLAGGPMETIYNATEKTLHSGGFHADFHVSVNSALDVTGSADCVIDIEEREVTALVEAKAMGQTVLIGIMDDVAVMQDPDGNVRKMELNGALDMVFESLEEDMTMDEALELVIETALETSGMEDMVDSDKAVDCVDKSLNSSIWLKKNAGYSTESDGGVTKHVFQPKLGDLVVAAVEALEPAFEDTDDLEEGLDYLEDMKSDMNDMAEIDLELGIKGGKLVSINADLSMDGQDITAEITFEDIGSADVDTDEIEKLIEAAQ